MEFNARCGALYRSKSAAKMHEWDPVRLIQSLSHMYSPTERLFEAYRTINTLQTPYEAATPIFRKAFCMPLSFHYISMPTERLKL